LQKTSSRCCLDGVKEVGKKVGTLKVRHIVERVIEEERVRKLGTVTDLASVSLRSISAGVET